jgi:hypothetical protein
LRCSDSQPRSRPANMALLRELGLGRGRCRGLDVCGGLAGRGCRKWLSPCMPRPSIRRWAWFMPTRKTTGPAPPIIYWTIAPYRDALALVMARRGYLCQARFCRGPRRKRSANEALAVTPCHDFPALAGARGGCRRVVSPEDRGQAVEVTSGAERRGAARALCRAMGTGQVDCSRDLATTTAVG